MSGLLRHLVTVAVLLLLLRPDAPAQDRNSLRDKARRLAQEFFIVDTHIDSPYRLTGGAEDLSVRGSTTACRFTRSARNSWSPATQPAPGRGARGIAFVTGSI